MADVSFVDLPADDFPFTIEFFRTDTGEVVHTILVEGPGSVLVPALTKQYGGVKMGARVVDKYGKSSQSEYPSD